MRVNFLIITLVFVLISSFASASEYYQATTQLNIRSGAGVNNRVIRVISQGDKVLIDTIISGWGEVITNGQIKGFVSMKYLTTNFKDYSSPTKKDNDKSTSWVGICALLIMLFLGYFGKSKGLGKGSSTKKVKNDYIPLQKQNFKTMISDVRVKSSFIEVFDSNSKRISYMSESNKEVVGITGTFFVVINGSFIEVYDEKCKRISYMSLSNKIVRGASGSTFTVKNGSFIETYDEKCKRVSYKSA